MYAKPPSWITKKTFFNEGFTNVRHLLSVWLFEFENFFQYVVFGLSGEFVVERVVSGYDFVEDYAKCSNIYFFSIIMIHHHFWCLIRQCPHLPAHQLRPAEFFTAPEVNNLQLCPILIAKYVLWIEITVTYRVYVNVFQPVEKICGQNSESVFVYFTFGGDSM